MKLINTIKNIFIGAKMGIILIFWSIFVLPILVCCSFVYFIVSVVSTLHDILLGILNNID